MYKIAVIPGDGIGPEITEQAVKVLKAVGKHFNIDFSFFEASAGGAALDTKGDPLPQETIEICKSCDSILFGAVGGHKWDDLPAEKRPENAVLRLRKELGLFANLRPAVIFESLADASPLKKEILDKGFDIMVIRELTGGIYFGKPRGRTNINNGFKAIDTMEYTTDEIQRIAIVAFEIARKRRKKVTVVDKSNVLETSRLWREVVKSVHKNYQDVEIDFQYVDNCSMQLVKAPYQFDVILTGNMFGDILSDESAALTGSIGMLPSASLGDGSLFLYEPIHGSAPDIAGQNTANPIASILSAALMLRYSFDLQWAAEVIENSVRAVLAKGYRTADIMHDGCIEVGTLEMGELISREIENYK
ncbi:MAG: 3-isopropylmalate dehydrogenase [Thermosediminibacterales bacterium]|nr:3-isopropylmalate dehydrogenase [Thermosediminibacterales bacterium]MDK2835251.1 3-isopropylmalate dehydrogenase [Thermosediminibacterales bacterium]